MFSTARPSSLRWALPGSLCLIALCFPSHAEVPGVPPGYLDISAIGLFGADLNPDCALSYFDNENNTPDTGEVRSESERLQERDGQKISGILKFSLHIPEGTEHYLGWYFSVKQGTFNLSKKTVLRFEMRGTPGIPMDAFQIGLMTANLNPNKSRAMIYLSELGYKRFPTEFTPIDVPVEMLLKREPDLDLSRTTRPLIFAIVAPNRDIKDEKIWIRNVRWAGDLERTEFGIEAMLRDVHFDFASHVLAPGEQPTLDKILVILHSQSFKLIQIDGHTDNVGGAAYNQRLSERRAEAVAEYLVAHGPISRDRLVTRGFGYRRPLMPENTETARARNRRVQILIQE